MPASAWGGLRVAGAGSKSAARYAPVMWRPMSRKANVSFRRMIRAWYGPSNPLCLIR